MESRSIVIDAKPGLKRVSFGADNHRLLEEGALNFCYCDESGTGDEPIATMVGVVVDAGRMHLTKADWQDFLSVLSARVGRPLRELHTADFYSGNGVWRDLDGPTRAVVITELLSWLSERKHHIVYTAVDKAAYREARNLGAIPNELGTLWRFMGFHLVLAIQRYSQPEKKNKGNTYLVFDNEEQERLKFPELILNPPGWSDEYYGRGPKSTALNQIIDVPVFGDSTVLPLIQVADFIAFFLRRYAEMKEGHTPARYGDEPARIAGWIEQIQARAINRVNIYPRVQRNAAHEVFYNLAPSSIRSL